MLIFKSSLHDPVYREEEEAFENWWQKTPLGRARQRLTDLAEQQAEEARKAVEEATNSKSTLKK